jgi:hypothetical protein
MNCFVVANAKEGVDMVLRDLIEVDAYYLMKFESISFFINVYLVFNYNNNYYFNNDVHQSCKSYHLANT